MKAEMERQRFKNLIFASSRGPVDPDLYISMFEEEDHILTPTEEADIEWVTPQTGDDLQEVLHLMRETGWREA